MAGLKVGNIRAAVMSSDKLRTYRDMRDFGRTPEPSGKNAPKRADRPIFVIQKHDASRLHYDFRLEIDGVLKSWVIPKGPSPDPREKRLAVETEDHPIDYADFEGIIPKGEYGGGTVLVWDSGTWQNHSLDERGKSLPVSRALQQGKLVFELWGQKLKGRWVLVHMRGKGRNWLLIKEKDAESDARRNPVNTETKSVLTGRTLAEIRRQEYKKDGL